MIAGGHETIAIMRGESLQAMPDQANGRLWEQLQSLGESLAGDGRYFTSGVAPPEIARSVLA